MKEIIIDLSNIRTEISFKSFEELRSILSFYEKNSLNKINIPCKTNLKKDFLLDSIKISREEFPNIDLIPHFSIYNEFKRDRFKTLNSLIEFIKSVKILGCNEILLVSGSQKRLTLDSVSTLAYLKEKSLLPNSDFSVGIAFNPYLPRLLFEEEIVRLKMKLQSGLVKSIWIQFGTDCHLFESRIQLLKKIVFSAEKAFCNESKIHLFGSVLIPSKQFLARFKYRPWKGVFCSDDFLESLDFARNFVVDLLKTYKKHNVYPIIETDLSNEDKLNSLMTILKSSN